MLNTPQVDNVQKTLSEIKSIVDNLLLLLSEKEKFVIVKRFNLDNSHKHTLEEIGSQYSITRERVRQIEKNALMKMKRNVFNTSLKNLHSFVSAYVRDHGGLLKEDALHTALKSLAPSKDVFDANSVHLSLNIHESLECVGNTINFYPYIRERNIPDHSIRHVADNIINNLYNYGDVRDVKALHVDLKTVLGELPLDLNGVLSLVSIDKRLTLLDGDIIGLMEWRHICPRTLRDKIFYVLRNNNKPMHFTEITKRIIEKNFDNKAVNIQAVHNELIRHPGFVLIGRGIYALHDWGYEKGTVAEVIEKILKGGMEMDQDQIINKVLEQRHVKKITIVLALKNGQKFERVGRKMYKLKH
ncbi:MAG: sigma factor-like helix-turn-helix DNA-binding protein [Candidatus Gracilibacteria bacterium]|jgi:hypothetical protein